MDAGRGRVRAARPVAVGWVVVALVALVAASCASGPDGSAPGRDADTPLGASWSSLVGQSVARPQPRRGEAVDIGAQTVALSPSGNVRLETLSTRADLVSGGDVLLSAAIVDGVGAKLTIRRDGDDVTDRLVPAADAPDRPQHRGLVDVRGQSVVTASTGDDPADTATVVVTDHPVSGPVLSGPPMNPFVCANERNGLDAPTDADCSAPTQFHWYYGRTDGSLRDLADPGTRPADLVMLTVEGRTVPFIVREERGVIDRSPYWISVLDDPAPGTSAARAPTGWDRRGWNGRLVYRFGGGCDTSYSQGLAYTTTNEPEMLRRGFAVTTATFNTFNNLCNAPLSAETVMMVKEHFAEQYGMPRFTISDGGSAGAMQQLYIAQNYPGLLDGITLNLPYPDLVTTEAGIADCGLLQHFWSTAAGQGFTEGQRTEVQGFRSLHTCDAYVAALLGMIEPTNGCDPSLQAQVYDPMRNRRGVRCTQQDSSVNVFGRDPATGFARRPLDSVGVQYGLVALGAGTITVDQFLDLNEHIGGYDIDGVITPDRMAADEATIRTAYTSGEVTQGGALDDTPILARNLYADQQGDIHDRFRSFSLRERLRRADGSDNPNVVLWTMEPTTDLTQAMTAGGSLGPETVFVMDDWLNRTDGSRGGSNGESMAERLARARPPEATDMCVINGERLRGGNIYDSGPCHDTYPLFGDPRRAAGAPLRNDIIKCTRRPVDAASYPVTFSDNQRQRLARVFPDGVCDWTVPGIAQAPLTATWPRFG